MGEETPCRACADAFQVNSLRVTLDLSYKLVRDNAAAFLCQPDPFKSNNNDKYSAQQQICTYGHAGQPPSARGLDGRP